VRKTAFSFQPLAYAQQILPHHARIGRIELKADDLKLTAIARME
jgi:hypothetical protein